MTDKPVDGGSDVSQEPPKKDAFSLKPLILVGIFFLVETIFMVIRAKRNQNRSSGRV